ncbi:MAG: hypothetical protein V3U79_09715 [Dehalococcoidia bacterium]
MDWGFVVQMILGILGAASIAGGIVAYRGSRRTGVRAFSAAGIAAGVVMWAIVAVTLPLSSTGGESPSPNVVVVSTNEALPTVTEENFKTLLTEEDVRSALTTEVALMTRFYDYKKMAESVDPAQVVNMDSWFGLTVDTASGADGITFTLIDFDSPTSADAHFEQMRSAKKASPEVEASFGGSSYRVEINGLGIGSMLVVIMGDKLLSFHTVKSEGQPPLVTLEGLDELAALVVSRLSRGG